MYAVCPTTTYIAEMIRMPFKHSIWFDDVVDFVHENTFIAFVWIENARNGWYLSPKSENLLILLYIEHQLSEIETNGLRFVRVQ